jgi:hypothetical protein
MRAGLLIGSHGISAAPHRVTNAATVARPGRSRMPRAAGALAGPPATISLRVDGVRLARCEALVAAGGGDKPQPAAGPAAQIIVQQCPDCERATITTSRGEKRVAPAQLAALACDARVRRPGQANRATIKPSVRAAVLARDRHRCATPGCRSTQFLEVHHVMPRGQGGTNRAENLVTLCSRCHGFVHEQGGAVGAAQVDAG